MDPASIPATELAVAMEHVHVHVRVRPRANLNAGADHAGTARDDSPVATYAGLDIAEPGPMPTVQWHPEREPKPVISLEQAVTYAAVGKLP